MAMATGIGTDTTSQGTLQKVVAYVTEAQLEARRRQGLDKFDEMWDGVLHMVPPPSRGHQKFSHRLCSALEEVLEPLHSFVDVVGHHAVADPERWPADFRAPDVVVNLDEKAIRETFATTADLLAEVLSPKDESIEKLPFYATRGVTEVMLIDRASRRIDLHLLRGGEYVLARPDETGWLRSDALGIEFRWQGDRFCIRRRGESEPAASVESP